MEPDNYDNTANLFNALEAGNLPVQQRGPWECAVQLAGIHDALIRLEATLRMIGVQMQERG